MAREALRGGNPVMKRLGPEKYELGPYPTPKVAMPGVYQFTYAPRGRSDKRPTAGNLPVPGGSEKMAALNYQSGRLPRGAIACECFLLSAERLAGRNRLHYNHSARIPVLVNGARAPARGKGQTHGQSYARFRRRL